MLPADEQAAKVRKSLASPKSPEKHAKQLARGRLLEKRRKSDKVRKMEREKVLPILLNHL